ncbi:unnamed protein product [Linum tenue]|uniref:S-protein homolog n=1 Tax=Linum tenue TaxID=586396 RepID=A0AAV0I1C1_9ROSI|nr:unnamed protein product [Linum tenue]
MAVIVHCRSKYIDLAARTVAADSDYSWGFRPNDHYPGNTFACHLGFQDKRLDFTTAVRDGDQYEVLDDGVYGTRAEGKQRLQEWKS